MEDTGWHDRLRAAIKERWTDKDRSLTELSKAAQMGQNYVSQMMKDGKAPKAQAVINIARVLNISLTWLFLGVDMTAEDEKLLLIASKIDTEKKKKLLDLLNSIASERP